MKQEKVSPRYSIWSNLGFIIRQAWKIDKGIMIVTFLQAPILVLLPLLGSYLSASVVQTPFSTRFFTVWLNEEDEIVATNIESISSVAKEDAEDYARSAVIKGKERGWIEDYRYKIYDAKMGYGNAEYAAASSSLAAGSPFSSSSDVPSLSKSIAVSVSFVTGTSSPLPLMVVLTLP